MREKDVKLTIRIKEELKEMVEDVAKHEGLSLNAVVNYLLGRVARKGRVNIDDCTEDIKQILLSKNQIARFTIVERIEQVLNFFGFTREEYPLVFSAAGINNIGFADVYDNERFAEKLSASAIRQLAELFDINIGFFYGRTKNIIKPLKERFYKNFYNFTKENYKVLLTTVDNLQSTLYISFSKPSVITQNDTLNEDDTLKDSFTLILEVPVARIDSGRAIYRYYVDNSYCYWSYWRCRHHLYLLLFYLLNLGGVYIRAMHRKENWSVDDFIEGHVTAEEFLHKSWDRNVFFDITTVKHGDTYYKLPVIVPAYNNVNLEQAEKEATQEVIQVFNESKDLVISDLKKLREHLKNQQII